VLEKRARSRRRIDAPRETHTESLTDTVSKGTGMPSVSAHVALTLAQHIDAVFGVMGNGNAYFLDALERGTDASFTAVRHEQGAVVAADAHYRASGRIAAGTATYGAGFTNTLTALAEAVQARIPLVLVVGDEPTSGPRPWDVDQIALASAVGARTYTVGRADAAATTIIAIEHALTYRLPVVLAIPYDVASLDAGPVPRRRRRAPPLRSSRRASSPTGYWTRSRPLSQEPSGLSCSQVAVPGSPARARPSALWRTRPVRSRHPPPSAAASSRQPSTTWG
jgi:hypothetical protein